MTNTSSRYKENPISTREKCFKAKSTGNTHEERIGDRNNNIPIKYSTVDYMYTYTCKQIDRTNANTYTPAHLITKTTLQCIL